jgi:hypothetical protein
MMMSFFHLLVWNVPLLLSREGNFFFFSVFFLNWKWRILYRIAIEEEEEKKRLKQTSFLFLYIFVCWGLINLIWREERTSRINNANTEMIRTKPFVLFFIYNWSIQNKWQSQKRKDKSQKEKEKKIKIIIRKFIIYYKLWG